MWACDVKKGALWGMRAMGMEEKQRRRGRPMRGWLACMGDDIGEKGLLGEEVYVRAARRNISLYIDPHINM